jgi:soluble lytic murein transglycosylase
VPAFRAIVPLAAIGVLLGVLSVDPVCAQQSAPVPLPPLRPAVKTDKTAKPAAKKPAPKTAAHKSAPLLIAPSAASAPGTIPVAPASAALVAPGFQAPIAARPPLPVLPLATTAAATASPIDLAAVKQAIGLVRKNRQDEATDVEHTITDPVARKLVEWVILRSDNGSTDLSRYVAFIAVNPSWPSIETLRRKAEAVLWQQQVDPQTVIAFFNTASPHTTKGHFALAQALLARGDTTGAAAALRAAWNDDFSDDLEERARGIFAGLITPADDEARMEARLYDDDDDAGLRAARHLNSPLALQVAKARAAVINDDKNAKALLDAVPEAGRRDPGYIFSRIQWLRRADKITDAAQLLRTAPRDPAQLVNPDAWWVERRLVARKLLDLGDARMAYEIANGAATPTYDNFRTEQHFTAGWIALRFLRQPELALPHFARIADGAANPITLARSFYWQARAEEALEREQDAAALYQEAARYPTAFYGQLARARLGIDDVTLRTLPAPPADNLPLEIGRALEILYAIDEHDLIASMAADLGDKATDTAALSALAGITTRHNDARATLLIGKSMLGRGYPFEFYAFPVFGIPNYQQIGPPVEPCVVYSIVRQESAFNPQVVSSANAIGLMQVTPDAGRDTAKKYGVIFDQRRLTNDVVYNAQLGTAELGNDIASWNGSYILAFVAYNAGPRRAREWIEQYGDPRGRNVDPIDWIERIPISETRNYVERVIENMQVYRVLVENNPKLLIEADLRRGG